MDFIITYWQEIVSLFIVGVAAILLIRSQMTTKKQPHACSSCALMKISSTPVQKHQ